MMEGPSRTAVLTAVARALLREEPPPWVLDDHLAFDLTGTEGEEVRGELVERLRRASLLPFIRWVCVRARLPEDVVEDAMQSGVRQYVVLGAGLDTFAYRRHDLMEQGLRVFEVDHPATQAWKRERLRELSIELPSGLVYAPIDFEHQTLERGLKTAGFDFSAPAVFSWIGVTMYLTLDAIRATLAMVAQCPSGTRIVLTYNQPKHVLTGLAAETDAALSSMAAEMGEPFISLFRPAEIEALLQESGFDQTDHFGPDEARAKYFPGRDDVHFAGAQRIITGTVTSARKAGRTPENRT
jgi:methyltransferase (TIGR00027 family)